MSAKSCAFDTGHHQDMTYDALSHERFRETAIKIVQAENWFTDYYASLPNDPFTNQPLSTLTPYADKLHFDNLFTLKDSRNYWAWLTLNGKKSVQKSVTDSDALRLLAIMGVTLHAVQDFYTHSNWVELHPRPAGSPYRTETWFSSPPDDMTVLYTGKGGSYKGTPPPGIAIHLHGDYHNPPNGDPYVNHDSYVRPRWDEAYVYAYVASLEWINAIHKWADEIDPMFWKRVQGYTINNDDQTALQHDLSASYRLSEWTYQQSTDPNQNHNGNWKGDGSGSLESFVPFALGYITKAKSPFAKVLENGDGQSNIFKMLSEGLYTNNTPSSIITVPKVDVKCWAVIVKTVKVEEDALPPTKPTFYSKVAVDGQTFIDASQQFQSTIAPSWTTIKFVPMTAQQTVLHYELWNEVWLSQMPDQHYDLNPANSKLNLDFTFNLTTHECTGDLAGTHDSATNLFSIQGAGDDHPAKIQLYVTSLKVQ